jgi:thiamine-monophosphate kinase
MDEFELIRRLTRHLPSRPEVVVGPGDDCAVLRLSEPGQDLLFKTDAVVEGVHFRRSDRAEQVGHKALARVLSDVAAMAGQPLAALVTLGLPEDFDPTYVDGLYAGLNALAQRFNVAVVGGETTRVPGRIILSISLLGTVARDRAVRRVGSKPGDALFVTGELGGSLEGHHLEFEPRLHEARWLADHFQIHAMIDLSDGLAGDLRHLLAPDGLGAELLASAIPISVPARRRAQASTAARPALVAALADGEDFELLFTVASNQAVPLLDAWKKQFHPLRLTCIGKITSEPGVSLRDKTGVRPLHAHGYSHFAEPERN